MRNVCLVDELVREEVNTIDSSDLFLDVFVTDHFTNYGGLLSLERDDATSFPQDGPVSVAQQPPPPRLMTKSRFTRWEGEAGGFLTYSIVRSTSSSDQDNLLDKLKEMARNSKTDESFDTKKFADLLDDYTKGL